MSAVHAMEDACGVRVDGPLRALRRLLYCGEWIESHTLHVYMLHAPDFLGYADVIQMARDFPDVVQRGLQLKKAGNAIVALLGGREVHPINARRWLLQSAEQARPGAARRTPHLGAEAALETVRWAAATLPCRSLSRTMSSWRSAMPTSIPSTRVD